MPTSRNTRGRTLSALLAALLLAAGTHAASAAPPQVRLGRIQLPTGVTLEVAQSGPADGEPVLFLHGYTDSWFSYSPLLEQLPAGVRAIVPSQRGHGDSDRPQCCYAATDFARDAAALLDALGIERATVVGHSMGSFVAQQLALDHPARVRRLVLIGSGVELRTEGLLAFAAEVRALPERVPHEFARAFQESMLTKPLPQSFLDRVVAESEKVPGRVWRDALDALLQVDLRAHLPAVRVPTLIAWGAHDPIFPRDQQDDLRAALPGARFIVYDDLNHSPHWEDPARFARDLVAFLGLAAAGNARPEHVHDASHRHETPAAHEHGVMPLLEGLGDWHLAVSTRSAEAQQYFDQGLRLAYGFNHDEAARSFERAAALDSTCAMCHWGIAYALGPNINLPMDPAVEPKAVAAMQAAQRHAARARPVERALIAAQARRFGEPAGAQRAARDSAYAAAMREVARRFPQDADALVLFADAMLNLRPWNQWTRAGEPQPGTLEVVATLERAVQLAPNHAGGCHFYVHTVEASRTPERALPCAERLPQLMPGAGHVVHMPAHVYLRVGRYEDAARANIAAVEADRKYFGARDVPAGMYPMFYAPHNLHFLWATYLLSGQRAKATATAQALTGRVSPEEAAAVPSLEAFLAPAFLTPARFGDWDAVLAHPAPPSELRYTTGMWHYARGLALAAKRDLPGARLALDSVRAIRSTIDQAVIIILNPAPAVLRVAEHVLAAHVALAEGRTDDALAQLRAGIEAEDALVYDEPPAWYESVRSVLGGVLLEAGRAREAESVFRADLEWVREYGPSLAGLERALRAQRKDAEADAVAKRLVEAWQYADVKPLR